MSEIERIGALEAGDHKGVPEIGDLKGTQPIESTIRQLLSVESDIQQGHQLEKLEEELKSIGSVVKSIDPSSSQYSETYVRVKYHDLVGDLQYLVRDLDYKRFGDLINKKILLFNSIPEQYQSQRIATDLNHKILQLFLISSLDFRKYNYLVYLEQNIPADIDELTRQIYALASGNKILPTYLLGEYISSRSGSQFPGYSGLISRLDPNQLLENWLENNMMQLSKYYRTIKISKIYSLLQLPASFDVEELLLNMIVLDKLPARTKLDQSQALLVFADEEDKPSGLNQQVTDIAVLLNDIVSKIQDSEES